LILKIKRFLQHFFGILAFFVGAEHSEGVDYLATRLGKRQLSKRSRLPLPLPADNSDIPCDNYANSDEPRSARGPFLAPDAQYEVIQQGRYSYYGSKNDEELQEGPPSSSYFREDENERGREVSRGFVISKGRVLKILIKPSGRSYVESSYLLRLFVVEYILLLILRKSALPGDSFSPKGRKIIFVPKFPAVDL